MKNSNKLSRLLIGIFVLGGLTAVALTVFSPLNFLTKTDSSGVSALNVPRADGEFEGDVEKRKKWFLEQRLYGLGEIPEEARSQAKRIADRTAPPLADRFSPANTWTPMGPQPTHSTAFEQAFGDSSGRINSIAVHPTAPNTVLLGTATGGVWRSTNALADPSGATPPVFAPVSDNQVDLAVGSIAFAASDPTVVYAGMGDKDNDYLGTGVLKSTDTGATWARVDTAGLPAKGTTVQMAVSRDNANTVFAARSEFFRPVRGQQTQGGFYRSTDGGANWTKTFAGNVSSIAQHPTNHNVIYISVTQSFQEFPPATPPARGVYLSTDNGQTFNLMNGAVDFSNYEVLLLATTAANANKIYAYGGTQANPFVLGAVNDGVNPIVWTANALAFNQFDSAQFAYNAYLAADPFADGRLYIGTRDVYRVTLDSTNNALNGAPQNLSGSFVYNAQTNSYDYPLFGSKLHADQQSFAFAGGSNTFFAGHDGGINRTTDGGATFTKNFNRSLGLTQAIGVTIHPTNVNIAYSGTQDNGTQRRENGTQWKEFSNGDGGYVVLNPMDLSMVFTGYVQGSFSRHTNDGTANSTVINSNFGNMRTNFYLPFVGNGTDSTLYTGTQTLAVCTDCATSAGQGTWTFPAGAASDLTRGDPDIINAVAVQKSAFNGTQVIYVGSNNGAFRVSQNGGAAFTDRTAILDNAVHNGNVPPQNPGRTITNIRIDPTNAGTAYITVSGFGTQHLFRSTNFGADIQAVPFTVDIPVNDFLIDPLAANTFYLATDIGIYRSADGGATWNQFNAGLPPVVVNRFDSVPSGRIVAATYGRGNYALAVPLAAAVHVAGRVAQPNGRGISGVRLTITDSAGQSRSARTNAAGYYRFEDVAAGETYLFAASGKGLQFADNPRIIAVNEETENLNFFAGR